MFARLIEVERNRKRGYCCFVFVAVAATHAAVVIVTGLVIADIFLPELAISLGACFKAAIAIRSRGKTISDQAVT